MIKKNKNAIYLAFLGPQGAGKGTQAEMLSEELGIPRISPGDILRKEAKRGTKLGKFIAQYINKGVLVPIELSNRIMKRRINRKDCARGFILDGYPRDMQQLAGLEDMASLDKVVFIKISDGEAVRRLAGRRTCLRCGEVYHLKHNPPKKRGICGECGDRLIQRKDDAARAIRQRLKIYHQKTEPVIAYYEKKKMVIKIDGNQSIGRVYQDIRKRLKANYGTKLFPQGGDVL